MRNAAWRELLVCATGLLVATSAGLSAGCKTRPTSGATAAPPSSFAANDADAGSDDPTGGGTIVAAPPAPGAADASTVRPREDLPGLSNFARVSDVLYRGAQPTAEGFRTLKGLGIKTVINLRSLHSDRTLLAGTGLRYVHLRAKAWHPEDEDIAQALRIIRDPAHQPVFVHCQHGADRTGVTVAAYRIVEQGWTTAAAAAELPGFRFHPIWTQVTQYLGRFDGPAMQQRVTALGPIEAETVP